MTFALLLTLAQSLAWKWPTLVVVVVVVPGVLGVSTLGTATWFHVPSVSVARGAGVTPAPWLHLHLEVIVGIRS